MTLHEKIEEQTPLEIAKRVIKGYADFTARHGENPCEDGEQIFLREMHKLAQAYESALHALEASDSDRQKLKARVAELEAVCQTIGKQSAEYATKVGYAEGRALGLEYRVKELEAELAKEQRDE